MTNTQDTGSAPFTYDHKGLGSHVEPYAFTPNGEPEWTHMGVTWVPGDSVSLRTGRKSTSFAVRKSALIPA